MSFGGYKFSGYRVDNTTYSTSIERCLAIHAARIRAFLNASSAAGSPWVADSAWLTGTLGFDASTGTITSGVNNGVIHVLLGEDGNPHGYSSYFKYSQDDVNGYYFIMTVDNYNIDYSGSTTQLGITLNTQTVPVFPSSYYINYGPLYASCFHCFSKDPFGHAPTGQEGKDYRYLNIDGQGASRLVSVGMTHTENGYFSDAKNSNVSTGFVGYSSYVVLFGYAIKDTDIIALCSLSEAASYSNPFNTDTNTHISVMSLNGFSELYCKDDVYKFLLLNIKNGYYRNSSPVNNEISCNQMSGRGNAILDINGNQLPGTSTTNNYTFPWISFDHRTYYAPSGANYTPFSGISVFGYLASIQCGKGCTNPELLCVSVGTSSTTNPIFSSPVDGSLLLIGRNYYNFPMMGLNENNLSAGTQLYWDMFIGWDSSNPDIKTDAAWPEYNAVIPVS